MTNTMDSISLGVVALQDLSFTGSRPNGAVHLWNPQPIEGDWGELCDAGREIAAEAYDYAQASDNAALLPGIVRAMVERGEFGGVEAGFIFGMSERLIAR